MGQPVNCCVYVLEEWRPDPVNVYVGGVRKQVDAFQESAITIVFWVNGK
jgi:hypothetical protein